MTKKKTKNIDHEELQAKCEEYLAGWKRAHADYDNLKKESEKRKSEYAKYAAEEIVTELIPIYDNMKMAIEHIPKDQKEIDWVVGVDHIKDQLEKFLESNGVEFIQTVGEEFSPERHEVIEQADESEDNIIKKEIQPGYKLHGKIIRVAKVVV